MESLEDVAWPAASAQSVAAIIVPWGCSLISCKAPGQPQDSVTVEPCLSSNPTVIAARPFSIPYLTALLPSELEMQQMEETDSSEQDEQTDTENLPLHISTVSLPFARFIVTPRLAHTAHSLLSWELDVTCPRSLPLGTGMMGSW